MAVDNTNPVFINGAGIAGLSCALALAESGYRTVVYEKAEGFETVGAGLQLSPNAMSALYSLNLAEKVHAVATEVSGIKIRDGRWGYPIKTIPLGASIRRKHDLPYLVIHRADLHQILLSACQGHPSIDVRYSANIMEMAPHKRGVTVSVKENGEVLEHLGTAAIVADGVWSALRTQVMNLPAPIYSGKVAWRALFPADIVQNPEFFDYTQVWFGAGSHVVAYPVRSRRNVNVVIITDGPAINDGQKLEIKADKLIAGFPKWRAGFIPLLEQQARWTGWPLFENSSIEVMNVGSIALAGDAAHAMLPFAAQGAAMALEDAIVLARLFETSETADEAMSTYSKKRIPRVRRVMKTARSNGKIYHMSGIASGVRDLGMMITPASLLAGRQDWIYRWRA